MSMYVLQCLTGREADIQDKLYSLGYRARVPMAVRLERCGGKWLDRLRVLMPGYVLVDMPHIDDKAYYSIKDVSGVLRWLNPGRPIKLADDEAEFIRRLTQDNLPLLPLDVDAQATGIRVLSGPLAGIDHKVISFDRHQRRAVIRIDVLGREHYVTLSAHVKDIPT